MISDFALYICSQPIVQLGSQSFRRSHYLRLHRHQRLIPVWPELEQNPAIELIVVYFHAHLNPTNRNAAFRLYIRLPISLLTEPLIRRRDAQL